MIPSVRVARTAMGLAICSGFSITPALADWQANPGNRREAAAAQALTRFRSEPKLERYFAEAAGFAVFPWVARVGFGTGLAHGRGIVIENDQTVGRTAVWEFVHGIWGGAEVHRMIIFFRDAEAVERYRSGGRWQFQGRTGVAMATVGASIEPSFDRGVAIFTQTRGGVLLEATVAAAYYRFEAPP